jgi:anti-sigma factor ChrR (cupin superfamily)
MGISHGRQPPRRYFVRTPALVAAAGAKASGGAAKDLFSVSAAISRIDPSNQLALSGNRSSNRPQEESMRPRNVLALSLVLVLAAMPALAQPSGQTTARKASNAAASQPVFLAAGDLKWTDLDPTGAPGVKIVDLWGDHTTGAYGAYLKLPAGFTTPLHTHTYSMKVVFLSGTYLQTPEGKSEVRLGPGSYMMQPGGNYRHITSCDKAAECVLFVESGGKFDLKPVDTGKATTKK